MENKASTPVEKTTQRSAVGDAIQPVQKEEHQGDFIKPVHEDDGASGSVASNEKVTEGWTVKMGCEGGCQVYIMCDCV